MMGPVYLTRLGELLFRLTWSSDLPGATFYVYVNGDFVTETLETTYDVTVPMGGQFQVEVFDDPDDSPDVYLSPTLTLRFDGDPDTLQFRVEQKVDGVWRAKDLIPVNDTRVFHYETGVLADSTVHEFQVIGVDKEGRSGPPLELTAEMCRYPDAPEVSLSISGGEIVIE